MKNMPLLKEGAELSLKALKANFRANDFSTAVSGYDCDRASSQDNRFYERLQKHFAKVWNAQMLQLSQKGSLLNYSSNHPVRCLEEAEAKLVAGTVMEILDNENLCRSIIDATLTSMEDSVMEDIQCYAQERGKSMEALSEKELDAAFDRFSDRFLGKMMNLLEQVQQVPEILNVGKSMPAQEDFSEKAWKNYDEINFERKRNHSRTKTGAMLELDEEMERTLQDFRVHMSFAAVNDGLDAVFTEEEVCEQLLNAFIQSVEDSTDREILCLRADGLTQAEIAQRLGFKNHSAVTKRLDKLRKQFKAFLVENK